MTSFIVEQLLKHEEW